MKRIFFLLILFPSFVFSQYKSANKEGIYKTFEDFKNNNPSWTNQIQLQYDSSIVYANDFERNYFISSTELKVNRKSFIRLVFCVVKDGVVYINGSKFDKELKGFKKIVFQTNQYMCFITSFKYERKINESENNEKENNGRKVYFDVGILGDSFFRIPLFKTYNLSGSPASRKTVSNIKQNFNGAIFLIENSTGKLILVDDIFMEELFSELDKDMLEKYQMQIDKNNPDEIKSLLQEYDERH